MSRRHLAVMAAVSALTVAGCGSSGTTSTSTPAATTDTTSAFTVPKGTATAGEPTPPTAAPEAGPDTTTSKLAPQSQIESNARELCKLVGAKGIAKEYGGDPADPSSVAEAFAKGSVTGAKVAMVGGCLDGLLASKKP